MEKSVLFYLEVQKYIKILRVFEKAEFTMLFGRMNFDKKNYQLLRQTLSKASEISKRNILEPMDFEVFHIGLKTND